MKGKKLIRGFLLYGEVLLGYPFKAIIERIRWRNHSEKVVFSLILIFILGYTCLNGQVQRKWQSPEDSVECLKNFSLYSEYFKQNISQDAYIYWQNVIKLCPWFSKSIYVNGVTILTNLINNEKDPSRKEKLIDTLFQTLEKRIEYFGERGYVTGLIGIYLLTYKPAETRLAYIKLLESVDLEGKKTTPYVLSSLLYAVSSLLDKKMIERATALSNLLKATEIAYLNKDDEKNREAYQNALTNLSKFIAQKFKCDEIEKEINDNLTSYNGNVPDYKVDVFLTILNEAGCTKSETFYNLAEQSYNRRPTYESAISLAKILLEKKDYSKAIKYLEDALQMSQQDTQKKVSTLITLASVYENIANYPKAREYAEKAIELDKNSYTAYIIIANSYSRAKGCGDNECTNRANYWVATDVLYQAKKLFPDKEKEINSLIQNYSYYYPKKEECFFYGIKEGDEVEVKCWINKKTKARF